MWNWGGVNTFDVDNGSTQNKHSLHGLGRALPHVHLPRWAASELVAASVVSEWEVECQKLEQMSTF